MENKTVVSIGENNYDGITSIIGMGTGSCTVVSPIECKCKCADKPQPASKNSKQAQELRTARATVVAMYELLCILNLRESGRLQYIIDELGPSLRQKGFQIREVEPCSKDNSSP